MIEMKTFRHSLNRSITVLHQRTREFAPYAAIEILLPGGSLLALVFWLLRRRMKKRKAIISANSAIEAMVTSI